MVKPLETYDKAAAVYLRLYEYSKYIKLITLQEMIGQADGYLVEEDETGFTLSFRVEKGKKREAKK